MHLLKGQSGGIIYPCTVDEIHLEFATISIAGRILAKIQTHLLSNRVWCWCETR
jgi:hypothetical protein